MRVERDFYTYKERNTFKFVINVRIMAASKTLNTYLTEIIDKIYFHLKRIWLSKNESISDTLHNLQ
ncbi:hypothetical protein VPR01S_05_01020 [Vibrio proteolyticus NBRC 13287]|uniref:Uncharacterized protein n=1 Tax=Vibrio proteolyticus NBRC 13287 TaxID=1219065 RepID=U3A0G8_VIBPR|nr:hypothetical protein VPR01S_05_01020 [Vibrio proteolyticus NBRC 13287]